VRAGPPRILVPSASKGSPWMRPELIAMEEFSETILARISRSTSPKDVRFAPQGSTSGRAELV